MKRNLIVCFLSVSFLSALSLAAAAGKRSVVSAGAANPAIGPVKSLSVGGIYAAPARARQKQTAKKKSFALSAAVSAVPSVSTEFVLGDVYVYPNPAKSGAVPVLHVETGIADSVKVAIYTVSGRKVHEDTVADAPQVITVNGNTAYAYEYSWNGHIASGVYYYIVETQKAGRTLRKAGKFAVVR